MAQASFPPNYYFEKDTSLCPYQIIVGCKGCFLVWSSVTQQSNLVQCLLFGSLYNFWAFVWTLDKPRLGHSQCLFLSRPISSWYPAFTSISPTCQPCSRSSHQGICPPDIYSLYLSLADRTIIFRILSLGGCKVNMSRLGPSCEARWPTQVRTAGCPLIGSNRLPNLECIIVMGIDMYCL